MIDKEKIEETKKQMIANLKEGIEESLLENFVERFEEWQMKLRSVNSVISLVDPSVEIYGYNEFCKKIIEITKNCLDEVVDYDKLFLTSAEYYKIMNENLGNENEMEKAMLKALNKKFMDNLMIVMNKTHLKESVKYKLGDQFARVEDELEMSFEAAETIMKNYEKNEK